MRTMYSFRQIGLACAMLMFGSLNAQVSTLGNQGIATDFVGWDATNANPELQIRQDEGDEPISFFTTGDAVSEMWLTPTLTGFLFGGAAYDLSGNLGVGEGFSMINPPMTRLHLRDEAQAIVNYTPGFRNWMRTGVSCTEGRDGMYVGLMEQGESLFNPAIINWSSNIGPEAIDPLRFIFTSSSVSPGAMATAQGLELARLLPDGTGNEGYFGIGDFFTAGVDPDQRLDILNGNVQIRDMMITPASTSSEFVTVDMTTGILEHRPLPTFMNDCKWTLLGGVGTDSDVATAYASNPGCPQQNRKVGIGTNNLAYKLDVRHVSDQAGGNMSGGLRVDFQGNSGSTQYGAFISLTPEPSSTNILTGAGLLTQFTNPRNFGAGSLNYIHLDQGTGSAVTEASGAKGVAYANSGTVGRLYGMYGEIISAGTAATSAYGVHGNIEGKLNNTQAGIYGRSRVNSGNSQSAVVHGGYGASSWASGTTIFESHGLRGVSTGINDCVTVSYGVRGHAANGATNYGVYGSANPGIGGQAVGSYAGFFEGDVEITGRGYIPTGLWQNSDAQFKTNVEQIDDAMEILAALEPKRYDFIPQEHPHLVSLEGSQMGLIAQELQAIVPALVDTFITPAIYDTLGNEIAPRLEHLAVNYIGLIPVLIAGHKTQQAVIDAQQAEIASLIDQAPTNAGLTDQVGELLARMDQLEQLLALCCQNPIDPDQRDMIDEGNGTNDPDDDRNLRIQPNPFNEQTTIYYNVERSGRMQLMANSSDGKQLRVLQEAQMEAGQYQYEWHTADLSAGIYYVTLLLDGEPIVKKAVKVN